MPLIKTKEKIQKKIKVDHKDEEVIKEIIRENKKAKNEKIAKTNESKDKNPAQDAMNDELHFDIVNNQIRKLFNHPTLELTKAQKATIETFSKLTQYENAEAQALVYKCIKIALHMESTKAAKFFAAYSTELDPKLPWVSKMMDDDAFENFLGKGKPHSFYTLLFTQKVDMQLLYKLLYPLKERINREQDARSATRCCAFLRSDPTAASIKFMNYLTQKMQDADYVSARVRECNSGLSEKEIQQRIADITQHGKDCSEKSQNDRDDLGMLRLSSIN